MLGENDTRFKSASSMIRQGKAILEKNESPKTTPKLAGLLKKIRWWESELGPKQKKTAKKIINIYKNNYNLSFNEDNIIDNKIVLIKYSKRPYTLFDKYLPEIYAIFRAILWFYDSVIVPQDLDYSLKESFRDVLEIMVGYFVILYVKPVVEKRLGPIVIPWGSVNPIFRRKIMISFDEYKQDKNNIGFLITISHELAHFLKLPNDILLANAYAFLMTYSLDRQYIDEFISFANTIGEYDALGVFEEENKYEIFSPRLFIFSDEVLKVIQDPVIQEATIRKILSTKVLLDKFKACSNRSEIRKLVKEVSVNVNERDYKIPHYRSETFNKWVYNYGEVIGYIAIQNYSNKKSAFQYIYRLGQLRNSRELNEIVIPEEELDLKHRVYKNDNSPLEETLNKKSREGENSL
ncbi:MAG: hypothetical protein JW734_06590 [Candidatus Omnitrophica bacterium]|nr:hypothetical protein [Candidatus Omnitrophota bacterium]